MLFDVCQNNGPVDDDPMQNCGRCGTKVYFAEELVALGRKWHRACFKCSKFIQFFLQGVIDCYPLDFGIFSDKTGTVG